MQRTNRIVWTTLSVVLISWLVIPLTLRAEGEFEESARWIPADANTLVLIRVKDILESPFGKEHKWSRRSTLFDTGLSFGPGKTERILMGSNMDFEFLDPIWSVCLFEKHGGDIDLIDISKQTGGILDEFKGRRAILLPSDSYLIELDENTLGSMYPGNRQAVARWYQTHKNGAMDLSPYLKQAVRFADENAQLIMAIDLSDVVHPGLIRKQLTDVCDSDSMDAVCDSICSIRGITLGVTVTDKMTGALKIDFNGSTAPFAANAKALVIEALKRNGLMIDDLESWEVQVSPAEVRMKGPLSVSGLRKISSIVQHPMLFSTLPESSAMDQIDPKTRSLQYFHSLDKIMDELQKKKSKSMSTYAYWYSRYARMIDELPSRGVDPDLLEFGRFVANQYRNITGILREANYNRVVSRSDYSKFGGYGGYGGYGGELGLGAAVGSYGYGYGRYGYYSNNWGVRARQIAGTIEKVRGMNQADEIRRMIEDEKVKIRHAMSEKFETDFRP